MNRDAAISVVIPTFNRADTLKWCVEGLLAQQDVPGSFEVIIVDNNSTDDTRAVVASLEERSAVPLTYLVERNQGVSYARNTGIAAARAETIAFLDNDVRPAPNWLRTLHQAFLDHPQAGLIGGKILPQWQTEPPAWLTRDHWAPLALIDYGEDPFVVDAEHPLGLLTANLAVRRRVFERVGVFGLELQRVGDGIGSMEDHELQMRLLREGIMGVYVPGLVVTTLVPAERMQRAYHRRWHAGHGRFHAIMRSEELEPPSGERFLDVPAYLYKQAVLDAARVLRRRSDGVGDPVTAEMRLCFFSGFVRRRFADGLRNRSSQRHQPQDRPGDKGGPS